MHSKLYKHQHFNLNACFDLLSFCCNIFQNCATLVKLAVFISSVGAHIDPLKIRNARQSFEQAG